MILFVFLHRSLPLWTLARAGEASGDSEQHEMVDEIGDTGGLSREATVTSEKSAVPFSVPDCVCAYVFFWAPACVSAVSACRTSPPPPPSAPPPRALPSAPLPTHIPSTQPDSGAPTPPQPPPTPVTSYVARACRGCTRQCEWCCNSASTGCCMKCCCRFSLKSLVINPAAPSSTPLLSAWGLEALEGRASARALVVEWEGVVAMLLAVVVNLPFMRRDSGDWSCWISVCTILLTILKSESDHHLPCSSLQES